MNVKCNINGTLSLNTISFYAYFKIGYTVNSLKELKLRSYNV